MSEPDIPTALAAVLASIRHHEQQYARPDGGVRLLAVSKRKPVEAIAVALEAGQRAFGENYLDEALEKIAHPSLAVAEWHFIGGIQSRKCAAIAAHFHWVHSVDRLKVASRLSANRPPAMPALNICIQVNIDAESSKSGVSTDSLDELADACVELPGLRVRGLMCIPEPRDDLQSQRASCARMRENFNRLAARHQGFDTLSMGMSGDLEAAIAEGSTMVRVGTGIFGARD